MKRIWPFYSFYLFIILIGCSGQSIIDNEKRQAMMDYKNTSKVAETWLKRLDSIGYAQIAEIRIISDNVPSDQVASFIDGKIRMYGKIKKRTFLIFHLWTGKKLLTWVPEIEEEALARIGQERSKDGFYDLNPAYFSFMKTSGIFRQYPMRRYMALIYRVSTEKQEYVNEMLILWKNDEGDWEIISYNIGEDL